MSKEYEITTIKDVTDCVNSDNIDNFIKDFRTYLELHIGFQGLMNAIGDAEQIPSEVTEIQSKFHWIDDGKHEHKIIMDTKSNNV